MLQTGMRAPMGIRLYGDTLIKTEAVKISKTLNIDSQRKSFKPFSAAVIEMFQVFGIKNTKVYVQYCPMADNDKGGFWLSNKKEIENPYFGDMMLKCGEVKDSIEN